MNFEHIREFKVERTRLIRKMILRSIYVLFGLFFAGFLLGQTIESFSVTSITFLKILSVLLLLSLISYLIAPLIRRILAYQIIWCLLMVFSNLFLFFSMYISVELANRESLDMLDVMLKIALTIVALVISTTVAKHKFESGREWNIKTGKIDLQEATWDFEKQLHITSPEELGKGNKIATRLYRFSIFAYVIGAWLARWLNPSPENLSSFILMSLVYLVAFLSGNNLNLLFQIRRWEREIGKPILIKPIVKEERKVIENEFS